MSALLQQMLPQIPFGSCQCGCGQSTEIVKKGNASKGWIKGERMRFVHGHNVALSEEEAESRFWKNFRFVPSVLGSFCWQWSGYLAPNGYGNTTDIRGERQAHRVSYVLLVGLIPSHLELDHLCRNRACINPAHLEPVTRTINARRGAKTKLTIEVVEQIRISKLSERKTAALHGVSRGAVHAILSGRSWKE